jgi:hypothetical protein
MRTVIALAMALTASVANAQQPKPAAVMGVGIISCTKFAQTIRENPDAMEVYLSWGQGFMSAVNLGARVNGKFHNLNAWSTDDQKAFLRKYCTDNLTGDVFHAVVAMYGMLPVVDEK